MQLEGGFEAHPPQVPDSAVITSDHVEVVGKSGPLASWKYTPMTETKYIMTCSES